MTRNPGKGMRGPSPFDVCGFLEASRANHDRFKRADSTLDFQDDSAFRVKTVQKARQNKFPYSI